MAQTATAKAATATPSTADLMRAAQAMLPMVEAEADEAERVFHMTDKVVDEWRRTGLNAMLTPKELGGPQLSYSDSLRIVEKMAHADGSTGWCLMVQCVMGGSIGSMIPEKGAETVFGKGADIVGAGNGVPRGFAREVDGGYMFKGNWSYGSGIHHAEWIHSGCFIMDGDKMRIVDGAPDIVLCHHPRNTVTLKGNWDVLGLRGTGSYDYTLTDGEIFVPKHMTYKFNGAVPQRGGIQYSAGLVTITTWGHTGWALGVGRRTLDELAKMSHGRVDAFGKMTDSASFKQKFAEAESKYRAARAFVYESWDAVDEAYAQGREASVQELACIRMAMKYLHQVISENATFAHIASRGVSLRPGLLQRCYRDVHGGTQHLLLSDEIFQECGRVMLGAISKDAQWMMLGVHG
ncbi:MAG TPA: acyl-CoA dehydrogenase family protein [Xanthobacteraceae bacterium]|nr:acyl-CoA dehydrogenase family protein [Xanthobacteraceae bacterium]